MSDETPNPQGKAAKKSAASKPKIESAKPAANTPAPPPNILFGPSNSELNPAYAK